MAKKFLLILSTLFVLVPVLASASTGSCMFVGNIWQCNYSDPDRDLQDRINQEQQDFQRKLQQDQQQRNLIQQQLDMLKTQYGSSSYSVCYAKSGLGGSLGNDPSVMQSGYTYIKYCLESQAIRERALNNSTNTLPPANNAANNPVPTSCSAQSYNVNGKCLSPDQYCQQYFGIQSLFTGNLNDKGGPICRCLVGFEFNQSGTACVPAVTAAPAIPKQPATAPYKPKVNPKADTQAKTEKAAADNAQIAGEVVDKSTEPQIKSAPSKNQETTTQQAPSPKPSFFRRIANFFKNLF